jgi:hypothetical protein
MQGPMFERKPIHRASRAPNMKAHARRYTDGHSPAYCLFLKDAVGPAMGTAAGYPVAVAVQSVPLSVGGSKSPSLSP